MAPGFSTLGLSPPLLAAIEELGYTAPTPIQRAAIPALLAGRDVIGQARTGSGKTAAFALPILQRLDLEARTVQALVLCPTRELSTQVAREFRALGRGLHGLAVVELVGGQPAKPQRAALERGVHVAVGTPGRLLDHLDHGSLRPDTIRTVVLDEADRMLDMGFGAEVSKVVAALRGGRQTALFSATFPDTIEAMCARLQRDALRVTLDGGVEPSPEIRQVAITCEPEHRYHALCHALATIPHGSALVFCNFKASVAELTERLKKSRVSADRLDGDLDQFHRDQVLARFRNQSVRVLVATDVAGRGIDVDSLDLVVNYELPLQPETYVHRIGRTGRAGREGVAVSLVTARQQAKLQELEERTGQRFEVVPESEVLATSIEALLGRPRERPRMVTILISGGRKDKVRAGDILGALTGSAGGLAGGDVGKIELQDRLSYVAVDARVGHQAVQRLNEGRIKGRRYRATLVGVDGPAESTPRRPAHGR
jgi:ATP-independent RNA helicase DbpA